MAEDIFEVKRERFDLLRPEIYLLQGTWPEGYRVEAYLKKQQIPGEIMPWDYVSVLDGAATHEETKRVTVSLTMPEKIEPSGKLVIYAARGDKKIKWFEIGAKELAADMLKCQMISKTTATGHHLVVEHTVFFH